MDNDIPPQLLILIVNICKQIIVFLKKKMEMRN